MGRSASCSSRWQIETSTPPPSLHFATSFAEVPTGHGIDDSITPETFAVVALALFQGLVRQRRIDPARVSDELFGQVLSWLLAGMPKAGDAGSG
ncbi:hypothetical protein E4P42_09505 [Mycobacterium sp. PS03-16]|uniref:hypothetical protein n=1 Tax=Mycobacterium sp. PS03-16 TaxID=2559611 RepID=UPI001074272B|nr:hypothetical protein [Mycobacterium sp. PS03-16]TFV59176.1 hypothetical protein E4P42_09505 [Mycobacterium sp. PS03-16]